MVTMFRAYHTILCLRVLICLLLTSLGMGCAAGDILPTCSFEGTLAPAGKPGCEPPAVTLASNWQTTPSDCRAYAVGEGCAADIIVTCNQWVMHYSCYEQWCNLEATQYDQDQPTCHAIEQVKLIP